MSKRNWWESRSAADDGLVDDETDSWYDDFDFDDFTEDDSVASIWGRYGRSSADAGEKVVNALRVVQGFVDTFATGDRPYRVTFDESVGTAGTDFEGRKVVVSHKPLFDPTLSEAEANTVLTAMAVHESSHVRYGRNTAKASRSIPDPRAQRVSNILDDVRIEKRFVRDYPGYADVFAPAIAYVAKQGRTDTSTMKAGDLMVASLRYAEHVTWTDETIVERDWWTAWSDRWTRTDSPKDHVAGIVEALAHMDEYAEQQQEEQQQEQTESESTGQSDDAPSQPETGTGEDSGDDAQTAGASGSSESSESGEQDGDADAAGASGSSSGEQTDESGETDGSTSSGTGTGASRSDDDKYGDFEDIFAECFADRIDQTAQDHGETSGMDSDDAQDLAERAKALVDTGETTTDYYGNEVPVRGEVYWGPGGIAKRRSEIGNVRGATQAIRAAFARSRTGHYATARGQKSGRIDSKSLSRIAANDFRLFSKRTAPSEDRYLVWLLVDCSGSMSGFPINSATAVAASLATASRYLPNIDLHIWGWTDGFRIGGSFGAVRVWSTGDPVSNVGYLPNVPMMGTPDAQTLSWASRAIRKMARSDQKPVIIIASDGAGYIPNSPDFINDIRKTGVEVVSVAIGNINPEYQRNRYGARGFVPWTGSIASMAKPLADLIVRVTQSH